MRPIPSWRGLSVLGMSILALGAGKISGTEDSMKKLPNHSRYRCAICHVSAEPRQGSSELNLFGVDFLARGGVWSAVLAGEDSDKDTYTNGFEIGDDNGDGVAEIEPERSNPGDIKEIPSSIDPKTWGLIKSLFDD
ncbi:MAG: hypothetical protein JW814_11030 [Candidatus Krumholzibacteriota bacterium]|nr:hypothetical protein [Candidatus Krumholzibacteriota bacterium]